MQAKRESTIQGSILKALRTQGGWWLNVHGGNPYMPRGLPDIIGCFRGRFFAFEVKRPGEKPTPLQKATLARMAAAGAKTAVVTSAAEAVRALEEKDDV